MFRSSSPTTARHASRALLPFVSLAIALAARPAAAQLDAAQLDAAPSDSTTAAAAIATAIVAAPPAGPTLQGAAVAARRPHAAQRITAADARAALAPVRRHHGQAAALMIVGSAAVVLGILVGDDAETPLVVGGAVVGLIGLYQYLL